MPAWIVIGLSHGAMTCGAMMVLVVASLRHDPMIWAHDAPAAMREQAGPPSPATRRRKAAWTAIMLLALVLLYASLVSEVAARTGSGWSAIFSTSFGAALIAFELFNLFDALVLDLALAYFKPRWALLPGVDPTPLDDPRWHLRNFLLGVVMGLPFAALVAGLGVAVLALAGSLA